MGDHSSVSAPDMNLKQIAKDYTGALSQVMPAILGLERNYRDDFQRLNLRDTNQFLKGSGTQPGLYDLSRQAGKESADQIADLRNQEFKRMTNQTDQARHMFQALSPESAGMVRQSVEDANVAQRAALGLTGGERRSAEQFAREASAERGRVGDNSAIAAEVLNRDDVLARKRAEAANLTNNAFGMAQQFYTQPGLQALYQTPSGYQAGQQMLGMGLGAIGAGRPQMVDIGQGFNLGAMNAQNQLAASGANAQLDAQRNAQLWNTIGQIGGSAFKMFGAV